MSRYLSHWLETLLQLSEAPPQRAMCWRPAVDVYRTPEGWLLKFDLAGVPSTDVTIAVDDRRVHVRGIRRDRVPVPAVQYHMEIEYSRFERTIELPETLDPKTVITESRDGMLYVRVATRK